MQKSSPFSTFRAGFTLVELSIVLVILGLLVGGVLTGQSLIRAAELRSVTTQYSTYITAVQSFRDKYFAVPGDMSNATAFWGAADGGGNGVSTACLTAIGTGTATCNGNGNGKIDVITFANEGLRFWQHLANAGLIEGNYTGVDGGSFDKTNVPVGRISSSLWFSTNWGNFNGAVYAFDGVYDNVLSIGVAIPGNWPANPLLKPEEAWNIDTKLDDGKPGTGKMVIYSAAGLNQCTDTSDDTNIAANYNLGNNAAACALMFRQAY